MCAYLFEPPLPQRRTTIALPPDGRLLDAVSASRKRGVAAASKRGISAARKRGVSTSRDSSIATSIQRGRRKPPRARGYHRRSRTDEGDRLLCDDAGGEGRDGAGLLDHCPFFSFVVLLGLCCCFCCCRKLGGELC